MARERIRHGLTRGDLRESSAILADLLRQQRNMEKGQKGPGYKRLVTSLSKSLKGLSEETLIRLGEQAYDNTIARSLYSEAIALVEAHRRAGHRLVIVSAATHYQIDPIARVLGIEEVCCTGLEVENGIFTGATLAPLCYGEGKAMAARRVCKRLGVALKHCWFYSDSIDDLPLLSKVGTPVAVNATEQLRTHASEQGLDPTAIQNPRHAQSGNRISHPADTANRGGNHCPGALSASEWASKNWHLPTS